MIEETLHPMYEVRERGSWLLHLSEIRKLPCCNCALTRLLPLSSSFSTSPQHNPAVTLPRFQHHSWQHHLTSRMAALPYISIQPNYPEVFSDVSSSTIPAEKVWLSYYSSNAPSSSVHLKLPLTATKEDGTPETQGQVRIGEVELSGGPSHGLTVSRVKGSWLDLELTQDPPEEDAGSEGNRRSARSQQSSIELDSGVQVKFAKKTVTKFLPIRSTSKVNDNYTNYPTIDAFDLSLGTAEDEMDMFVAGGAEGSLYTGRLAEFDADEARQAALATLTEDERHILSGEAPDPNEDKWDLEARIRLHINSARSRLSKKTQLKGHVGDIRFVRFFPSNRVVLSTSSDLSVRIWDPFTGENPRTLEGHKRAVLAAGIIGKGRTVLTAGADGSVRLWDVAAPKQVRLMGSDRFSAVNALALNKRGEGEEEESSFVVGLASGNWQMFDLRTATPTHTANKYVFPPGPAPSASELWTQTATAAVTAIDVYDHTVVTGTANGVVSLWDTRALPSSSSVTETGTNAPKGLVTSWRRNNAEVNSLKLVNSGQELLVATQDGLPYRVSLSSGEEGMEVDEGESWRGWAPRVVHEYAGWDCDQTSWIGLDRKGRTVIAGAEGNVRRY